MLLHGLLKDGVPNEKLVNKTFPATFTLEDDEGAMTSSTIDFIFVWVPLNETEEVVVEPPIPPEIFVKADF